MIIKEYNDKDTENRTRVFVDISCEICSVVFKRQKRLLKTHTCSAKCRSLLQGTQIKTECAHCGKDVYRSKSKIEATQSGLSFCNRLCKEAAQKYNTAIQPDHYGNGNGEFSYRQKAIEEFGASCNECGYKDNIKALDVHHKDKNRSNNNLNNLEVLCCNCHAIKHR